MNKEIIYTQIFLLKTEKKETSDNSCAIELIRTTGYVNIIDMLLLPLYYTWEYSGMGALDEVQFEFYLMKAYKRFCTATRIYTRQIILILKKAILKEGLTPKTRSIIKKLITIYSKIYY